MTYKVSNIIFWIIILSIVGIAIWNELTFCGMEPFGSYHYGHSIDICLGS